MRRLLYFVVTAGLVAATAVALASASSTAPRSASATGESANAYLPKGTKPLMNDWNLPGGDQASTLYSQLKEINSNNVGGLKVVWNGSYRAPAAGGALQSAPLCCPSGLMYQNVSAGVVGINPADGTVAWEYKGVAFDTVRGATTTHISGRGIAWSAKTDYIYANQNDGSLVALKAKTGAPVWTSQVVGAGSYGSATGLISQPAAQYYDDGADGIVVSAPNGGESPFRGHLDAYNAKTGALVWRSWTTPDPTQLPYILTWSNPAEASQGGAAVWSIPAVDSELGLVYFGTGNLFPWTGRQPGDNLWGTSLQAVDWKTGALRWYYQEMKHDNWDLDSPQPPTVFRVPINGKMTPVVAEGGKSGLLDVVNARNGAYLPHFNFTKIQTYDPTGRGRKLNSLSATQWIPQGAAGCVMQLEMTAAAISKCAAIAGNPVAGSAGQDKVAGCNTVGFCAQGTFFPADYVQISYGGTNPTPGLAATYGPNVQGENGKDPCPTCKLLSGGKPVEGTSFAAAHTSDAFFAFGGTASGPFNYPFKTYSPQTHNMYACVRMAHSAKGNAGVYPGTESTNAASVGGATTDPRLFTTALEAINMTNNTFSWQYGSKASTFGTCNAGTFSTAGNLVFNSWSGRTDPNAATLLANGIAGGGVFAAFDATTGKLLWQWGSPGANFAKNGITYSYKGKQYIAIYHSLPASTALGGIPSNQRDQMTVFSL